MDFVSNRYLILISKVPTKCGICDHCRFIVHSGAQIQANKQAHFITLTTALLHVCRLFHYLRLVYYMLSSFDQFSQKCSFFFWKYTKSNSLSLSEKELVFSWRLEEPFFQSYSFKRLFCVYLSFMYWSYFIARFLVFVSYQHGKQLQSLSSSPKARTTGFSVTTGQGSPSDSASLNRWFKPEVDTPSSIRSIQIEERAMKDLKRFYSSVKIVKNQS